MKWYDDMISVYEETLMKEFIESFGFNLKLNYETCLPWVLGTSNQETKTITIHCLVANSYQKFLSVLFHEMSHLIAGQNGQFKVYHSRCKPELTTREIEILRKTALKAEIFVDKNAKELMKSFFPDIPYKGTDYKTKNGREWLRNRIETFIKSKVNLRETI